MNHTCKTLMYLLCWSISGLTPAVATQVCSESSMPHSLQHETEQPLSEILKQLEHIHHKTILFTYNEVSPYQAVLPSSQKQLSDCLDSLFTALPFEYIDKGEYIVVKKTKRNMPSVPSSPACLKGRITDAQGLPVEAALVWLVSTDKKQCLSQTISSVNGDFSLDFPKQPSILMVTCLGYTPYTSEVLTRVSDLRETEIRLEANIQQIDNVVVVGQRVRPVIEQKGGKLIFNVANTIHAQGENALEILRQTPGVLINDASKSIALNGRAGVLIMLNGKQTYMEQSEVMDLLKSTPSSHIQSIEIMNNATAQYDASGSGGILNIILKRPNQKGYNMQINTGIAYWLNLKQNTEVSFNYNRKKLNLYGSYNHLLGHSGLFYGSTRKQNGQLIETQSDDTDKRNMASSNLGIDYELNAQHHIGAQVTGNFSFGPGFISTKNQVYDSFDKQHLLYHICSESENYHQVANRYTANLNYVYTAADKRSLTIDIDYSLFKGDLKNRQPNIYYNPDNEIIANQNYLSFGYRDIHLYAGTLNYKENFGKKGELTGGMKYSDVASENEYNLYQTVDKENILDTQASNRFDYRESILSAFLMYDSPLWKKWQFNIGCRMEYTHSKGVLHPVAGSTTAFSEVSRNYVHFFPSASLTYQIGKEQTLSLSYGKRIDRPVYADLNPIDQPLDGLSSWRGNPFLTPQHTHRLSLEYQYKKTILETSYSVTNDYRVQITDTLEGNKIVMIPRNLGKQTYYGLAVTQNLRLFHAWDIMLYGRAYYLDNKMAFDEHRFYHRYKWAYECSLHTSFPLWWGIKGEILGSYTSPRLGSSTDTMRSSGQVNIGFQKKFWQDKASVKLSMSDIFWTSNWDNTNSFDGFEQTSYGYGESRMIKLNFTFKFGTSQKHHSKESSIDTELNRF